MSKWILRRWHHVSGSELIVPCGVGEYSGTGMKLTGPGKHPKSLRHGVSGKKVGLHQTERRRFSQSSRVDVPWRECFVSLGFHANQNAPLAVDKIK